jgi:prepilin-type processing-associated H-X9-DG protein
LAGSGVPPWFGAPDVVCGSNEVIAVDDGVDYQSRPDGPTSYFHPGDFSNKSDGYFWYEHGWHFWSGHNGGANFVFADGSVHFLNYSMGPGPLKENPDVFHELATRAGCEVIEDLEDNF